MQVNLHLTKGNQFTKYSNDAVFINQIEYKHNILVNAKYIEEIPWKAIDEVTIDNVSLILKHQPDLIIWGTGSSITFPNPDLLIYLYQQQIGVEVMQLGALCRTFNYLIAEERNVLGVILF